MGAQKLEITLNTLTPLWTGGVKAGEMDRLHETGIIGSLRWWYEALLRGVGGRVCNPMGNLPYRSANGRQPDNPKGKCQVDSDYLPRTLPNEPVERRQILYEAGLCDACQIFGATGWRRQFRLLLEEDKLRREGPHGKQKAARSYIYTDNRGNTKNQTPSWFFKTQALGGILQLKLIPAGDEDVIPIIAGLLQFIADWSALAARSQVGFGVVNLLERVDRQPLYNQLISIASDTNLPYYNSLPGLHTLFFVRLQIPKIGWQEVFNLKYDLRQLFSGSANRNLRHSLFGTTERQSHASKIKISAPYGDLPMMRVWGWVSNKDQPHISIPIIHTHLSKLDPNLTWRELNSSRDNIRQHTKSLDFLADLLEITL